MTKAVTTRRSLQKHKPTARIQKSVLKRKRFKGLPKISADQKWVSDGSGRNIWITKGKNKIVRYAVTRTESYMVAEAQETTDLHGPVQCLCALTETEVLAVVGRKEGPQWLVGVSDNQHRKIAELKEAPLEVVVSGQAIVYLEGARHGATLVSLDRRTGRIIRQEPLNSAAASIRPGRDGSVLVAESGGTLRYVSAARRQDDCRDPEPCNCGTQRPPSSVPPARSDCCCGCVDTKTPQPSPNDPNGTPNPRRPKDPDGRCVPGDDGIPEDCWVTTYLNGRMIRVNICDPVDPCTTQIPFRPAKIQTGRNRLFASSADGRRTLVLDSNSLQRIDSLLLPRGTQVFALAASDAALFLTPEGTLELQDFAPTETPTANAAQASAPITHLGVKPPLQYDTLRPQHGIRNVMIIPVLEPGQPYSGNTDEISQHYEMVDIIERAQSYFEEVSYASPDNDGLKVNFVWFGADTPTLYTGPPVTLERSLKEYWGDPWDPGHIRAVIPAPAGTTVSFSGDEELRIRCRPAPEETYTEQDFTIRFPAGSYRARIPNSSPTVTYEASLAPLRQMSLTGTDRQGNPFSFTVDTSALTDTHIVDLTRSALELNNDSLDALADTLQELLDAGAPDLFERPSVLWHDDGSETGMLHIAVSFADAPGEQPPELTDFAVDDLLNHISDPATSIRSIAARFDVNSNVSQLQTYFRRIVSDSHVRNSDFGPVLATSYFEMDEAWRPWARVEGGELETRISLSTSHGRDPSRISLISQTGLTKLGYNAAIEGVGNDASFSGGGGPTLEDMSIFDDIYTAMIEASIAERGEATAASAFNQFFNCEGLENEPISCFLNSISSYVITPVYPGPIIGGTNTEPDLENGERGAARSETMSDLAADNRSFEFKPISAGFKKIVMKLANDSPTEDRAVGSSATLTHELGHTLLGYRDLYTGGTYRDDVKYVDNLCLMGSTSSFSHFCAYHKRIKGWLSDDATIVFDRPQDGNPLDEEIILAQLEYFDPLVSPSEWSDIAQAALPGASAGLPVVAAAFLRLGGDGRQFNILELRGRGPRFSRELDPPRIGITNAIDPNDDTRYGEPEVEGSGTTRGVLERYRRFVHLLSTELREATIGTDEATYDFATDPTFPEVGLTAQLLEWGTASNAQGTFNLARVRVRWDRGPAINLGFQDATPDWQSPDIAVIQPEDIDPSDGSFDFPEMQEDTEQFRIPAGDETLMHKIAVRVWNFGDATAENVQIGLLRRVPKGGGGGDWETDAEFETRLPDPVAPSSQAEPPIVSFDWPVNSDSHTHLCFRAEIGDRDVPRDDNGVALASDDTDASNDWAQQNVFEFEAPADSPPDPVSFTFEVNNAGSYVETVSVVPVGLGDGATVTVYPSSMKIAPFSKGLFRVVVRLEERLLDAKCNKDIDFRLEVWRDDDHAQERWGSSRYVIKPRRRTQIELDGSIMPQRIRLFGAVTPDVGAQDILLQIKRAGKQTIWERITLGPASSFDFELSGEFPSGEEVRATAYFDGSFEHASSVSDEVKLNWIIAG